MFETKTQYRFGEVDMEEFFQAWWFLHNHPMNREIPDKPETTYGLSGLDIHVTKVNPENLEIDDDPALNTKVDIWLEFGPIENLNKTKYGDPDWRSTHDPRLDCGGDTFEDAIIELAELVRQHYGEGD